MQQIYHSSSAWAIVILIFEFSIDYAISNDLTQNIQHKQKHTHTHTRPNKLICPTPSVRKTAYTLRPNTSSVYFITVAESEFSNEPSTCSSLVRHVLQRPSSPFENPANRLDESLDEHKILNLHTLRCLDTQTQIQPPSSGIFPRNPPTNGHRKKKINNTLLHLSSFLLWLASSIHKFLTPPNILNMLQLSGFLHTGSRQGDHLFFFYFFAK